MGYNGFVAGIDETLLPWGKATNQPPEYQKYSYVVHAEANAILHAKAPLEGSKCYVTLFPCHECTKLIASVKVKEIIFLSDKHCHTDSNAISKRILEMCGISYRKLEIKEELFKSVSDHLLKLNPLSDAQ